ncbi:MAG TPA: hypothetical protein VJX67_11765 [Blastocatellia bacterium]|nr:hypothetical protein [Blastocatellia bacterium]
MKMGGKGKEYVLLAILMSLTLYVVGHLLTLAHEFAHGSTAAALGGYFPFVQVDADGGRSIYFLPPTAAAWKEALVLLAGPAFNLLVSIAALALVAAWVSNKAMRTLIIFIGGLSSLLLVTGAGLLPPWWKGYKETGQALELLGFSLTYEYLVKSCWLLIGILLVAGFFRLFFRELTDYFPNETYKDRFLLVSASLTVPVSVIVVIFSIVMLVSGYGEGVINPRRHWPHLLFLVLTFLLLPLIVTKKGAGGDKKPYLVLPKRLGVWAALALVIAVTQPVVFGNSRDNPRGIFLDAHPPELSVSGVNIVLKVDRNADGYKTEVTMLMRPFTDQHDFLWRRIKDAEPAQWGVYEDFVQKNLTALLGARNFTITGHHIDPQVQFFNGKWTSGARVVVAEADVPALAVPGHDDYKLLKVTDFWKTQGVGYIDHTEVDTAGNLRIVGIREEPRAAKPASVQTANQVRLEATSFSNAFTVTYVAIK